MHTFLVLISLTFIAVYDYRFHIIKNWSLFSLLLLLLFKPEPPELSILALGLAAIALFAIISRMGGGDVKLLVILFCFKGSELLIPEMLIFSTCTLALSIFVEYLRDRRIPEKIALAPAIAIAFSLSYLGNIWA